MLSRKNKVLLAKIFSLFSVVRGYNILIIVIAQYLASIFIFAPELRALDVLLDWRLFLIIFSSSLAIAGGYIINNFYDAEKDLINRPFKSMVDRLVSQATKLRVYFALNFVSVVLLLPVSVHASVFFALYIFLLWFYSHKLKKYPLIGNIMASLLAILPFFGIFMYFQSYHIGVFIHAFFLFMIIFTREILKDMENIRGDFANNYQTLPVRFGESYTKRVVTVLVFISFIPIIVLTTYMDIGYMNYYFYSSMVVLVLFLILLWKVNTIEEYHKLHICLKLLILLGVFSIVLIKPEVIASGQTLLRETL
ncbi:geranylgeranylglycerol-phosphate geranylgeranyltransferase [Myroides pelagicus]|uniref:Ubiquinone biosynthesis protein UbiA n=1 Tax=Myroides pelagicus TaxID=270914 RepID=A0A7K1GIF5_9FLAO|nr:geranylgeranylglycerol-phosphate geranylgeranyltransferase [Myroides pelagicus]MEC4112531.1 geranylgeranylglycerol-phosphate geranylgeranyltransferase [Myroides pelagicus]MTH28550.1 ubiquinone biosynthesis protein UbiA [Myroides pelagicus]